MGPPDDSGKRRPKFLSIDELEKMNKIDQAALLLLMETGIISETKIIKTREMELTSWVFATANSCEKIIEPLLLELTSWVFATANSCEKIIEPLLSRFVVLDIPEYTFEQFREIAISRHKRKRVQGR
jgi:MoxR-like ATPase